MIIIRIPPPHTHTHRSVHTTIGTVDNILDTIDTVHAIIDTTIDTTKKKKELSDFQFIVLEIKWWRDFLRWAEVWQSKKLCLATPESKPT